MANWQSRWLARREDCSPVDLGMWDAPHRNTWVNKLNLAIHRANGPVVLVAHGLGCVTAAWWAEYEQPAYGDPVVGALLVSPPDVDRPGRDERLARLGACPRKELPFPSYLAISRNDPSCGYDTALALARDWGSHFADMGEIGGRDAQGNLGEWAEGERLLDRLLAPHVRSADSRTGSLIPSANRLPAGAGRRSQTSDWKRAI
jgi:uncharacterized protein